MDFGDRPHEPHRATRFASHPKEPPSKTNRRWPESARQSCGRAVPRTALGGTYGLETQCERKLPRNGELEGSSGDSQRNRRALDHLLLHRRPKQPLAEPSGATGGSARGPLSIVQAIWRKWTKKSPTARRLSGPEGGQLLASPLPRFVERECESGLRRRAGMRPRLLTLAKDVGRQIAGLHEREGEQSKGKGQR